MHIQNKKTAHQRKKKTEMTHIWIDLQTALHRINTWGNGRRPFLFLTDYLHHRWLVEYLDCLSPDGQRWVTPRQPLLRGTMRQSLLDTGQLVERDIRYDEWGCYEKVSLINAMMPLGRCVCELKPAN